MKYHPFIFEKFVTDVRRRMIVIQFAECIGLTLSATSLMAIPLMALAIWRQMPTTPILFSTIAFGLIAGLGLSIRRTPTRLDAATLSDRQLRLNDLLATALTAAHSTDDFAIALRRLADALCASRTPSEVIYRQLGVRSWSAIAVVMSVAAVISAIPLVPAVSRADDANSSVLNAFATEATTSSGQSATAGLTGRGNDPSSTDGSIVPAPADDSGRAASASSAASASGHGISGGSSRQGMGRFSTSGHPLAAQTLKSSESQETNETGQISGGGNTSDNDAENHEVSSGAAGSKSTDGTSLSAVQSSPADGNWKSPVSNAAALAEHRDLIRDFFNAR